MNNPKVKVGDRVKVVECGTGLTNHVGMTGMVTNIYPNERVAVNDECYCVKWKLLPNKKVTKPKKEKFCKHKWEIVPVNITAINHSYGGVSEVVAVCLKCLEKRYV